MMQQFQIQDARVEDAEDLYGLYREVARHPGGLARLESEITQDYIQRILQHSLLSGLMVLAVDRQRDQQQLVGSIHAYVPPMYCFSHVLSELTIAVHPQYQGQGVGRQLFTEFMRRVESGFPDVSRVELITRQSNRKAMAFYESMGFVKEGEMVNRIKNLDGSLENDIPMAWTR